MDISTYVFRLTKANVQQRQIIKLELVEYLHNLGSQYSEQLRQFSQSVISNKEEWFKKSMTECVHQAGREVGYEHERTKVEIEATKILLQVIADTERVAQGETVFHSDDLSDTAPEATLESDVLPARE